MIDIHCHILPGLDDGAQTMEDAKAMARQAVSQGIAAVVATPHHADGMHNNEALLVREAVKNLNEALQQDDIPLQVLPGQEVRVFGSLVEELQAGSLLTLSDSPYLLLELPPVHIPQRMNDLIYELQLMGITPVIAHPERNRTFLSQPDQLNDFVERGVLCQVTTHSLLGFLGRRIQAFSLSLCKRNLIHFLASDAHNCSRRNFNMSEAYNRMRTILGHETCDYYMTNAKHLIEKRPIEWMEPIRPTRRSFGSFLFRKKI
jgi:protein-tyrosine phosphatase